MSTPNVWSLVGNWDFEVRGKVKNNKTGEEFDGLLAFTGTTAGIETSEINGERKAELHTEIAKVGTTMWELIVFDEPKQENEPVTIDDNELVEFVQQNISLSKDEVHKVLDLEFEFLKLKGVIEE